MGRCAFQECASRRVQLDTAINIIGFFSLMVKNVCQCYRFDDGGLRQGKLIICFGAIRYCLCLTTAVR
jgi:hypothetical protein